MTALFDKENLPSTIAVRVTPKAKMEQIKADKAEDGSPFYRIYVTAAPEDGKANKAVIKLLAKELGVAKSSLSVIKGETARNKVIAINS